MEHTKMTLRSSAPPKQLESKPKIEEGPLPYLVYKGKVEYYNTAIDCALTCDNLLKLANSATATLILGFDMEWPFSFQTGSGKTALIQICPNLNICYLLHVSELKKIPVVLTELLSHENVKITGVNIRNDIHKLVRDFPGVNAQPMLGNCIDSRTIAKLVVKQPLSSWSMEAMVKHFFKKQIRKDKRVRQSKWNVMPLSEEQCEYAATDAYASLKLYMHLRDLQLRQESILLA